jgi:hypothetical protein
MEGIGGKEKMLYDWMEVRNAILRADSGEMKITYRKRVHDADNIIGLVAEINLDFDNPVPPHFTEEEKSTIDAVKQELIKALSK